MSIRADRLIFDGRHLLWRTSDAHKGLSANVDGVDIATGGMYGFLHVALRVHARYGGEVNVAWEVPTRSSCSASCGSELPAGEHGICTTCGATEGITTVPVERNFRFKLYPQYKGKDAPLDAHDLYVIMEMAEQEARLKQMLAAMGVQQYMAVGCEGDDVMARLAHEASEAGQLVVIYTGDSDMRQRAKDGSVYIVSPETHKKHTGDKLYDEAAVEAKHDVPPALLAQLKALVGGKDNLPGVPGVGKKYGAILLNHYGSLTDVLRAALSEAEDWPLTARIRGLVAASAKDVIRFHQIAKVRTDCDMAHIVPRRSQRAVIELLKLYKFRSLAAPAELHGLMSLGGPQER